MEVYSSVFTPPVKVEVAGKDLKPIGKWIYKNKCKRENKRKGGETEQKRE